MPRAWRSDAIPNSIAMKGPIGVLFQIHTALRQLFNVAVFCLAVAMSAVQPSQAQQAEPHPLVAEYQNLSTLYRVLSACPDLIEEWELYEIRSLRTAVTIALEQSIGDSLSAAFQRSTMTEAAAASCASPQVQALAKDVRRTAQLRWKARYEIVTDTGDCAQIFHQVPDVVSDVELFARRVDGLLGNSEETRALLRQEIARLEVPMFLSCERSLHEQGPDRRVYNGQVAEVREPVFGAGRRAEKKGVDRSFDLNRGWTLGHGETRKLGGVWRRTSVHASRKFDSAISDDVIGNVIVDKAACGDYAIGVKDDDLPTLCRVIVRRDGGIGLVAYLSNTPIEYSGDAVLRIYNPQDGSVVLSLDPVKRDGILLIGDQDASVGLEHAKQGVTYFEDVITQIQSLHPLMQLGVVLLDENGEEISALSGGYPNKRHPATVAVGDIRQAYSFAYTRLENDLTMNGITRPFYDDRIEALKMDGAN